MVCGLLIAAAPPVAEQGLEVARASGVARRLSSRGASAWLSCGRTRDWDCPGRTRTGNLPRPGIEPVSLALAGGLLTTRPPGRSLSQPLICAYYEPSPGPGTSSGWSPSNLKTAL